MTRTGDTPIQHHGRIIETSMRTSATPRQVWEAWADPKKIAQWFVDRAEGSDEVGSTFTWYWDEFGFEQPYQVVASEPGRRFTMTLEAPGHGLGVLDLHIEQEGGETVLRLINSGFREDADFDDEYEGVVSGWGMALSMLKHYLEHHFGRDCEGFMVLRMGAYDYEQLHPYQRTADGLARWLTTSGSIGAVGDPVSLTLQDGDTLTGTVLCRTDNEIAVSWEEQGGVLELKAFSWGPMGRAVALRVNVWDATEERVATLREQLDAAVGRLGDHLGLAPPPAMPDTPISG